MTTKNYLPTAAALFLIALGYWFFTNYGLVKKGNEITTKSTTITTQSARAQQAAHAIPAEQAAYKSVPKSTLSTVTSATTPDNTAVPAKTAIQEQIELERQKLELQRQSLEALKTRRESQVQQVNNDFQLVMGTNTLQIQNLLEDLQNQRMAQNDVNENAAAALREQNSAAQYSRDQIDLNIQNTEQSIQNARDALTLSANSLIAGTIEEQARVQGLRTDLVNLTEQLRQLKEQRVNISATVYDQIRTINSLSQSQKQSLASSQNEIQNQISSLREENVRLQNQSSQTRMSLMPLSQQISQAEQAYQETQNRIKSVEQTTVVR